MWTKVQNAEETLQFHAMSFVQSTRVGMSVNAVRKISSDQEVQNLAKVLIKSWKKLIGVCFCVCSGTSRVKLTRNHPFYESGLSSLSVQALF